MAMDSSLRCSAVLVLLYSAMTKGTSIEEFFPDASHNLTKISWAHAVNNQSYLNKTLKNDKINMIEADVVLGTIINGTPGTGPIPIMAHPPLNTSDLSLEKFLQEITDFNAKASTTSRKGVKLDFKSIEVFEESLPIVQKFDEGNFPLWINADILEGPVTSSAIPVDSTRFLTNAKHFPKATLSIGWTTPSGTNITGSYQTKQIIAMKNVISQNKVNQTITFPVRAVFAAESKDVLVDLVAGIKNSTLTIWSSEGDKVNVENLRKLIQANGLNKTYIDVPEDLLEKLQLDKISSAGCSTNLAFPMIVVSLLAALMNIITRI